MLSVFCGKGVVESPSRAVRLLRALPPLHRCLAAHVCSRLTNPPLFRGCGTPVVMDLEVDAAPLVLGLVASCAAFVVGAFMWKLGGDRWWSAGVFTSSALFFVLYFGLLFKSFGIFSVGVGAIAVGNALNVLLGLKRLVVATIMVLFAWLLLQQVWVHEQLSREHAQGRGATPGEL